ncbi:NUDIX domain-containing protein [Kitasatospora sp. NPDC059648]|uniref:NUDIX domain-containing protein n=1 Tax=Kitasatospora sp. NPDC059648 TaxID=3346894 RepID=UPI00368AC8AB
MGCLSSSACRLFAVEGGRSGRHGCAFQRPQNLGGPLARQTSPASLRTPAGGRLEHSLPGGVVGDQDGEEPTDALRRELLEELGLDLADLAEEVARAAGKERGGAAHLLAATARTAADCRLDPVADLGQRLFTIDGRHAGRASRFRHTGVSDGPAPRPPGPR